MLDLKKKQEEATLKDEADLQASQVKGTKPSLPMSEYSGRYYDPKYGDVVISIKDKKLVFSFTPTPLFHGTLDHWHYDSFRLTWGEQHMLPKGMMTFVLDAEGKVDELKVDCPNPDLDFKELKLLRVRE